MPLECKKYCSPRWSGEIADCSLPVTLDTYNNCSFKCAYCFSQFQRSLGLCGKGYLQMRVSAIDVEKVKRIFLLQEESQFSEYIKDKRPIQWGGLSDQFDNNERKYGKTLELMRFFNELNYPISFSTKSAWVFHDERYLELFRNQKGNWNVKFSIITNDAKKASIVEQGVESPQNRLRAMEIASGVGTLTTLRLRPFIIGLSSIGYEDLITDAHNCGASALSTEFLCIEQRSNAKENVRKNFDKISSVIGFDILEYYAKNSPGSGYLRLNRAVKSEYVKNMKELCEKLHMRFYVSDAHFKELCNNSCCCGLPEEWKYSRGNFSYALEIAKKKGEVRFKDIEQDMYFLNFNYRRAEGFNTGSAENRAKYYYLTMKEYLKYLWNNPKGKNSPMNAFAGVLIPTGIDEDGNVVYAFNQKVSL